MNVAFSGKYNFTVIACLLTLCGLSACASLKPAEPVRPGDRLTIDYTCRLESGALIATTNAETGQSALGVERLFQPPSAYGPISVTAMDPVNSNRQQEWVAAKIVPLEKEIQRQLSFKAAGLSGGKIYRIRLTAEVSENLPSGSRYLKMARVRRRPKTRTMPLQRYLDHGGGMPEKGQAWRTEPGFRATVAAVTEREIVIHLDPAEDETYETIFGCGEIIDAGTHYEIVLDVEKGKLIRDRDRLGVVDACDSRSFTVDYGHPFGGEALFCDIEINKDN